MRDVRQALGLTLKEFSRGLNVAAFSVERWENGDNRPIGIQEMIYEALQMVIAQVPPERARAIGVQLRLGLGAMLATLLLREPRKPELDAESLTQLDALPERGGYATAKARREQTERTTGKPGQKPAKRRSA